MKKKKFLKIKLIIEENDDGKENNKYLFNKKNILINLSQFEGESFDPIDLINPSIYYFMISYLQKLISIPELNYYFINKIYKQNPKKKKNTQSKIEVNEENEEKNYQICDLYNYLLLTYKYKLINQKKMKYFYLNFYLNYVVVY